MDDPNYLRKVNLDEIDFSKYGKDYSQEELAAVKMALQQEQKRHVESFDSLPMLDRAKYHVSDMADFVQQNPETLLGVATGALLAGAGAKSIEKASGATEKTKQVFGSLRDMMSSKKEEGLLASQQAEKAALAQATPADVTAQAKPAAGVDTSTDIGKGFDPSSKTLIGQSEKNREAKKIAKDVGATDIRQFTRDAKGNIQWPEKTSPSARAGAEAFMQQYPDLAKQLEAKGQFAILGAGSGDNSLFNTYGAQTRKDIIQQVNQGNLAGTHGGNEGFYNKTLTPAIAAVPPSTPLGAELERLRAVEPKGGTHGILGKSVAVKEGGKGFVFGKNELTKAFKAGAPAALLMSIANAANAKEAAQAVGEAMLPMGLTPSELQSGKLTEKQLKAFEEAKKLGSPYRSVPPPKK